MSRLGKKLVAVKTGIDLLKDKVAKLDAVQTSAPASAAEALAEATARLTALRAAVEAESAALGGIAAVSATLPVILPENNTRILLSRHHADPHAASATPRGGPPPSLILGDVTNLAHLSFPPLRAPQRPPTRTATATTRSSRGRS